MKYQNVNFQARMVNLLPRMFRRPANNLRILPRYLQWYLHQNGRKHAIEIMKPLHNKYLGYRCVIIGNGPSLNKMDLGILKKEFTFGLNRIYLLFNKLGFETDLLIVVNGLVMKQFVNDINEVNSMKIMNWIHHHPYSIDEKTVFLNPKPSNSMDGKVLKGFLSGAGSVTNLALEVAYYYGFSEVVLIGVDHSYSVSGIPGQAIESTSEDQNHFAPNYFGSGVSWQLPNYTAMEFGYSSAKLLFESSNRRIVDATINGKLQVFQKVEFESHLLSSQYMNKLNNSE